MSKDKPEVGDIWRGNLSGLNYRITDIVNCKDLLFHLQYLNEDGLIKETMVFKNSLLKNYTYLGKSKANIEDLFKTENE